MQAINHNYHVLSDRCRVPMGLEDGRVLSGQLSASTQHNYNHGPDRGRLNQRSGSGRTGAWSAKTKNNKQWIQIDFGRVTTLTGIATQGRYDAHQWVTSYIVRYSNDGQRFRDYKQYGRTRVGSFYHY